MTQNVDHEIEQFWLGFKTSMKNFYKGRELKTLQMYGHKI